MVGAHVARRMHSLAGVQVPNLPRVELPNAVTDTVTGAVDG